MRYCLHPGCAVTVPKGRCATHQRQREQARPNADTRGWYNGRVWKALRLSVLRRRPLCVSCEQQGMVQVATDVDHIEPHRGDWSRFADPDNLQPLCRTCHSRKTQAEGAMVYR